MHEQEIKNHPWGIGGSLYCDTPPYPDWHFCYTPAEPIAAEIMRYQFSKYGWCKSIDTLGMQSAELPDVIKHTLTKYPDSCSEKKIDGYDDAVRKKYGPILSAMKHIQGETLPSLDSKQYIDCKLGEVESWFGESIVFEVQYRKCAYSYTLDSSGLE